MAPVNNNLRVQEVWACRLTKGNVLAGDLTAFTPGPPASYELPRFAQMRMQSFPRPPFQLLPEAAL